MPKTATVSTESIETDFSKELIEVDISTPLIEIDLPGGTRGLRGDPGEKGDPGKTPQFHIGNVTSTNEASASITGTAEDPVLNLGIPKGKSGVYVGDEEPTDEDCNVWIDPDGTPGTIPTKVSDLANDVGYITENDIPKDIYSSSEVLTNKVWIDSNNVEHPVYRRTFTSRIEDLSDQTIAIPNERSPEEYDWVAVKYFDLEDLFTEEGWVFDKIITFESKVFLWDPQDRGVNPPFIEMNAATIMYDYPCFQTSMVKNFYSIETTIDYTKYPIPEES